MKKPKYSIDESGRYDRVYYYSSGIELHIGTRSFVSRQDLANSLFNLEAKERELS